MNKNLETAKALLKKHDQEHLLQCYDKLTEENRKNLLKQILEIDFELLDKLYHKVDEEIKHDYKITPITYTDKSRLTEEKLKKYTEAGQQIIKQNQYAVVTMAGGQGTRLGHNGPKGTFYLEVDKKRSLFEIFCNQLIEIKNKYNVTVPWYLMTSKENNAATIRFFEENDYFGYPKTEIKFFIQSEIPMIDKNGKILLTEKGLVKQAANGHGGIFEAMIKNKILEDMKKRGIKWILIDPVDNPLVQMVDEIAIGFAESEKASAVGKSIVKAFPDEKVGVFCKKNGRTSVVEYTEISKEMAEMRDENNELVYGESHINCNYFNIKAIEKIGEESLPYHIAFKKASYLNKNGIIIKSEAPNCYKFETFIFDSFEKLESMKILRVKREEEFAPVKNREGIDSPETAIKLYKEYHKII